jgi:transposase-like protein
MIIDEITYTCRRCGSANLVKNGHNKAGSQQFRCKNCGKSAVLKPKNRRTEAEKEQILAAYRERPSMRGIARVFGISCNTLAKWLKKSQEAATAKSDPAAR